MKKDSLSPITLLMAILALMTLASREHYIIPALLAVVYLLAPLIPFRATLSTRAFLMLRVLLILPFAAVIITWIATAAGMTKMFMAFDRIPYTISLYFALLIAVIALKKKDPKDAVSVLALCLLILISSGYRPTALYLPILGIEVILIIIFCIGEEHRCTIKDRSPAYWRSLLLFIMLFFLLAFAMKQFFNWAESKVSTLYNMTLGTLTYSPAFSYRTELNSIENLRGSSKVLLRVFSDTPPAYLSGRIFLTYRNGAWQAARKSKMIAPAGERIEKMLQGRYASLEGNVFYLGAPGKEDSADTLRFMTLCLTTMDTENLPIPPGTLFAMIKTDMIWRDDTGMIRASVLKSHGEYRIMAKKDRSDEDPPADLNSWLQVPENLPESIRALNRSLINPSDSAWGKSQALLCHFHRHFTYGVAPKAAQGRDMLERFLLETKQGHCEFFATSMTLMLRLNDIPARYVNGFLVDDYNAMGGYYRVRGKDAHAWVEAWFPGHGWTILDPTPAQPPGNEHSLIPSWAADFYDMLRLKVSGIMSRLISGDILGSLMQIMVQAKELFQWLIQSPLRLPGLLIVMALVFLIRTKGMKILAARKKEARSALDDIPADRKALHQLLRPLEKALAARKLIRKPCISLLEFSRHIEEMALEEKQKKALQQFFDHYCRLRFGGAEITAHQMEEITEEMKHVKSLLS